MSQTNQGRTCLVDGRIVWKVGDLFTGRKKTDMNTRQPVIDPKTGQQVVEFGFGLAVPKSALNNPDPTGQPGVWACMTGEAQAMYPSGLPPAFAWKYSDGDGTDHNGKPFNQREGHAGCIILKCTTRIPIKYFKHNGTNNELVPDGIKCGDYVRVHLSVKAHGAQGTAKPGLYLNPGMVQFLAWGAEIVNTPDGDDVFGTTAPPIPPGGSATPIAPAGAFPGQPMPAPGFQPPPIQQQFQQPPAATPPPMAPPPHHAVLPPDFQPPPGGQVMAAPPQYQQPPINAAPQFQPPPAAAPGYFPPQNFAPQQTAPPQYQQPQAPPAGYPPPGMPYPPR